MPRWAAVLRSGRAVVAFFQHPSNPEHDSWFDRIWTAFPDPDQVWVEASAHEPVTGAAVLADRVAFTAGFEGLVPVFVIRTPGARQRLMEFVEDDEVREKVAAVNLRKHSLVVLNTIGTLSLRGYAEMLDQGQLSTETKPRRSLRLGVDDLRQKTGTMLIVDRLPAEPDDVFLDGTRPGAPGYSVLLPSGHLWVPRLRRE